MDLLCESKADSTVKTYHAGFIRWKKWAVHNGISRCDILPAKSLHVALYLSSLVQNSHTASPVISAFYSIQWAHHMIGQTSPTENLVVKNVLEGAKRRLATRIEKKEPVTPEILSKMYSSSFKEYNVMSQRFICACLLAYSGFLRVSELLNIRRCDIIFELGYISIFIPKSKTDIYRDGNSVVIACMDSDMCPVKNLKLYLLWADISPESEEFIFRNLTKFKDRYVLRKENKPLSYTRMRELFIEAFQPFVSDIKKYGLHSLRSGGATTCANLSISDRLFKRHGRWRSETAKDGYIKDSLKDRLIVSENLGL
ncbi:uncharacterized protein [Mytilus edulis]|uniref:uncharacterized protein n=1 Tax=Mytilus edulis TaxID=6550 RepID=UPI0039F04056